MATQQEIANLRIELADTDAAFPLMTDTEYAYYIDKHSGSLRRAMLDVARALMFKLSYRTDETVDIFSIKGSKSAEQYRMALQMFIKNPDFNPALSLSSAYAGGISKSDMQANVENEDNNTIVTPNGIQEQPDTPFEV